MVLSRQRQAQLTRRLQDFLENLGRENLPFGKNLDIDGVVCLANRSDHTEQVVLKVHHKSPHAHPLTDIKPRPSYPEPLQVPALWNNNNNNDMPQDLSTKDTRSFAQIPQGQPGLNHTVRISAKPQPAPLQLVNKVHVGSLLYRKITEGGNNKTLTADAQSTDAAKDQKQPKPEEIDPALTQGETLCKECSETVFGGFMGLQKHTWDCHEKYVCKTCYHTFTLRCNLRRHERLHEGHKPYKCDYCEKTFSRSTDLRMHMQKHQNNTTPIQENQSDMSNSTSPAICQKCNKSFDSVETLRRHMYRMHKTQDDQWPCNICERLLPDQEAYDEHKESHVANLHRSKRQRLDLDEEETTNDDQVMREEYQRELIIDESRKTSTSPEQDDSSNEPQNYPSIKKALTDRAQPSASRQRRKGKPTKLVPCCSDSEEDNYFEPIQYGPLQVETMNPGSTNSPAPSVESENDPLANSYNSDVLASTSMSQYSRGNDFELPTNHLESLQTLSQVRSPLVIKPENASSPMTWPRSSSDVLYSGSPLCPSPALSGQSTNTTLDDTATTPDPSLDLTPQSVDDGDDDKEYTCTYGTCNEPCLGFKAYELHTISAHNRYPCKLCKQTFSGKNNRTRHMRNHNRAKIYPCPVCRKYFSRPDSMREHRYIHTYSYQEDKCRRCNQEFSRKSLLLAHLKNCFKQSRTKNGSIDESPYMFGDSSTPVTSEPREASGLALFQESMARVKLENNNEAILPPALEFALTKDANVVLPNSGAAQVSLLKKNTSSVGSDNGSEDVALDLANPAPNNNTDDKPLDLATSADKPAETESAAEDVPSVPAAVKSNFVETPQVGTV